MSDKLMDYNDVSEKQKDFAVELYEEHLQEVSFLYTQRMALLEDPDFAWRDLDNIEDRVEAHIDALLGGEDIAFEVCRRQAQQGDDGELHGAMRVFCRKNRQDVAWQILEMLEGEDPARFHAVCDALKHDFPTSWEPYINDFLSGSNQRLKALAAEVVGYRRLNAAAAILPAFQQGDASVSPVLIWALGRVREPEARKPLLNYILSERNERICRSAALALLRMGEPQILNHCCFTARSQVWPLSAIGLGGDRRASQAIRDILTIHQVSAEGSMTLGLLGDIGAIDILISHLAIPNLASSAAEALRLITGADLYEEVFVPEELETAALFDDELEKLRQREPLTAEGDSPAGVTVSRLSQKAEDWQRWWRKNQAHFDERQRYRDGKPYSPACLLENLRSQKSPRLIRQLAYEELVIRYGIDFPFETDMPVIQQNRVISAYADWINTNGSRFRAGEWYFGGHVLPS